MYFSGKTQQFFERPDVFCQLTPSPPYAKL
jgi:hypothetical protein